MSSSAYGQVICMFARYRRRGSLESSGAIETRACATSRRVERRARLVVHGLTWRSGLAAHHVTTLIAFSVGKLLKPGARGDVPQWSLMKYFTAVTRVADMAG